MEILQIIMNALIIIMHTSHADAAQESRRYIYFLPDWEKKIW
jgi:hypothetical protein